MDKFILLGMVRYHLLYNNYRRRDKSIGDSTKKKRHLANGGLE